MLNHKWKILLIQLREIYSFSMVQQQTIFYRPIWNIDMATIDKLSGLQNNINRPLSTVQIKLNIVGAKMTRRVFGRSLINIWFKEMELWGMPEDTGKKWGLLKNPT